MKFSLLFLLGSILIPAAAQPARSTVEAIHFIKLANSFRALERSPQAINLLVRALPAVESNDVYWASVAYELLGLAHNEQENRLDAIRYLQQARSRYRKLRYEGSVWVVGELIREISGRNLYAGIQFGSSGAKLAIFQTRLVNGFYEKDIKRIDIPNETNRLSRAGKDALAACIDSLRRYNIPNERIFVVIGSEIGRSVVKMPDINNKQKLYNQLSDVLPKGAQDIDTTLTPCGKPNCLHSGPFRARYGHRRQRWRLVVGERWVAISIITGNFTPSPFPLAPKHWSARSKRNIHSI